MEFRQTWKGREIKDYDPELQEHVNEILSHEFLPYALADHERARRILKRIITDEYGKEYLADYDGNYLGPWLEKD
ncbi:MAG TPA: hypothetical protein VHR42_10860 [Clostridia bacterium]|nr:hypothetical protein [Clostridia bacterium]